jgi:transcription elongation factor GreB
MFLRAAMKKGTRFASSPFVLVRLAGIEPTTPWFVAKYSIQLSYSREAMHYGGLIEI